jgi:outer membrane protein TolC
MPEEVVTAPPTATPPPTPAPAGEGTPPAPTPAPAGNAGQETWEREKRGLISETQRERAARQKSEGEFQTLKAQYDQSLKRINALAGINPKSQSETDDDEIKAAFAAKFPHLADLTPEDIQAIRETRAQTTQLKASTDAMWKRHTNQVLGTLNATVADKLGGGDLSPKQKDTLRREYIAFIEAGQADGKAKNKFCKPGGNRDK